MHRVRELVIQICSRTAHSPPTVLVCGETGTGKGLVARALHEMSVRAEAPFVDVNCAAIPASLIESELFGYERGAFTDARTAREGLFEAAAGGSVFLDEINSMPVELQAKLLTVIEEKQLRRIGSRTSAHVDVQVVAATQQDLREYSESGAFRADLFHRLNVLRIDLPPLRERGEDRLLLAEAFVREACDKYLLEGRQLDATARELVLEYSWPGNVRELKNQIERAVLLNNDPEIRAEHFTLGDGTQSIEVGSSEGRLKVALPNENFSLAELDREIVRQALTRHEGNVSRAARYLGISRQKLIYRMKKHGFGSRRAESNAA
jgi:transcriptional regulator with PAS, ATPase and Fis domain